MKKTLKKIWIFIKTYWYIFVIIIGFVLSLLFSGKGNVSKIFDLLKQERDLADKERELIDLTDRQIDKEVGENLDEYFGDAERNEKEYQEKKKEIEKNVKEEEKKMANEIRENPEKTLRQIAHEMGWTYE